MTTILKITSSARYEGSVSRILADKVVKTLKTQLESLEVIERDVAKGLPVVTEDWVHANFTADEERTDAQREILAKSDKLIAEIQRADILVIATPIYNFSVPATLKAWIDLVCRARKTFQYTENGPVGLLDNKRAIIAVTSGGTPVGSEIDYATDYLRHILGFIGINDVQLVFADRLMASAAENIARAEDQISSL